MVYGSSPMLLWENGRPVTLKTVLKMVLGTFHRPRLRVKMAQALPLRPSGIYLDRVYRLSSAILDDMASGPSQHGVGLYMHASGSQFDRKVAICHLSRWLMRLRRVGRTYTVPLLNNIDAKTRIFSGLV